jgi:hypothetical protein
MKQDHDPLFQALASLPPIAPDIEWETRVRTRCQTAILRRASRRPRAGRKLSGAGLVDLAASAALSFYLAAVLIEAARLGGLFY